MELITLTDAAAFARVSPVTIRNYQKNKRLTEYRNGGRIMVDKAELVAFFTTVRVNPRIEGPTRVFTIASQKGGVGKTTTAVNLGYNLAQRGATLLIDADPQGNLTQTYGLEMESIRATLYEVFVEGMDLAKAIVQLPIPYQGIDLVPATLGLASCPQKVGSRIAWERMLVKAIAAIKHNYDYIVIDCPPTLEFLTINALVASTDIVIPLDLSSYSLVGARDLIATMLIVDEVSPMPRRPKFLINRLQNTKVAATVLSQVEARYKDMVLCTKIRNANIAVGESQMMRRPLAYEYPDSGITHDYEDLVKELLHA